MKDNHSYSELIYKPRWLEPLFASAVVDHPVVILTGARQTGKSTFLRNAEPVSKWRYLSLDNFDIRKEAETNPKALWAGTDKVVIDEVQHSPRLLSAVKMAVDEDRGRVRFVLSGSANLLLMRRISETLAGRAVYFTLLPMTMGEIYEKPSSDILARILDGYIPRDERIKVSMADPFQAIVKGFLPPLIHFKKPESAAMWWEGYIATYLERDLREISHIESLVDFRRVMAALALRSGQMLNQTEIARDTGISQSTVHRYINLLETTCLALRHPAFSVNRTKRLIKAPKFYWIDSGLASYLSGFHDHESLKDSREAGASFETFILHHIKVLSEMMIPRARVYYWRTVTGREVDFVIEHGRRLLAIEVKLATSPRYADVEGLRLFLREYPETALGVLVYNGDEIRRMDEKIIAIPWTVLAGLSSCSFFEQNS
jgi:hypothetical protein